MTNTDKVAAGKDNIGSTGSVGKVVDAGNAGNKSNAGNMSNIRSTGDKSSRESSLALARQAREVLRMGTGTGLLFIDAALMSRSRTWPFFAPGTFTPA